MEETKETSCMEETKEIETASLSDSSGQVEQPSAKKQKKALSEKQRAVLTLGREKARNNRETKMKAKLDGMLEEYLKDKKETSQKPKRVLPTLHLPTCAEVKVEEVSSCSEAEEDTEDEDEDTLSSDGSSNFIAPPKNNPVLYRTSRGYARPRTASMDLNFS